MLFREHNQPGVDCLTLKTFLKVVQTDFLAGDKIPFTLEDMFQRIEIEPYVGEKINKKLPALLNGFPINESTLRAL